MRPVPSPSGYSTSVERVLRDKTEEKFVQIFKPSERSFSLVFCEKKMVAGGYPFYLKFWVKLTPLERNRRFSVAFRS